MKKLGLITTLLVLIMVMPGANAHSQGPITIIIKEAVKKVIIAIDLKIQRLQTKTISLQNAQKVVENEMSKLKLNEITTWVQKQKDLYQQYFQELSKVKETLLLYHRIKEVTDEQIALVKEYKSAYALFKQDKHFSTDEITYIGQVYAGILDESAQNLDQLLLVVNSFTTQMTDAKRLDIINHAAEGMDKNYKDLKAFNNQNIILSLQRAKDENDISVVKQLYGL